MVCAGAAFAGAPAYSIVDLGRPGTNNVGHADGISSGGNYVVGRGVVGANNAFVWNATTGTNTILTASNTNNWAVGVNDSGVIVGMSSSSAGVTDDNTAYTSAAAVVWKNGTPTTLNASGRVFAINNAGLAVGSTGTVGAVNQRAVLYDTNALTTTVIGASASDGATMNTAWNINNAGLVIGTGNLATSAGNLPVGLVYDSVTGTMTQIASASMVGGGILMADVNNNGVVVGSTGSSTKGDQAQMPFEWSAAAGLSALPVPAGFINGTATGINDQGWVVGYGQTADGNVHGFLDISGTSYLLDGLVTHATGWTFANAASLDITGIGNDGTISGWAFYNDVSGGTGNKVHAFALEVSAVPEPSSYALMFGGLLAVGAVARRRKAVA